MKPFLVSLFSTLILTLGFTPSSAFAHAGHSHSQQGQMIAHLSFESYGVHAHLYWDKEPTLDEAAVLRIEFRKAKDHSPTDINASLSVRATMPDMNHGDIPTAPPVKISGTHGIVQPGVYSVDEIYLYMGGRWEIILTLSSEDGVQESEKFELIMEEQGSSSSHQHHH